MNPLAFDLNSICDVDKLIEEKEKLKLQVVKRDVHWVDRIDLYQRIKEINERITQLSNSP